MSFARCTPQEAVTHRPRIVLLNEENEVVRYDEGACTRSFKIVGE
jgi:aspartate 1-decarboxylase